MNLFKRSNGIYYIKYLDSEGIEKRISTKRKRKKGALQFLSEFKSELNRPKLIRKSFSTLKDEYLNHIKQTFSKSYHANMKSSLDRLDEKVKPTAIKKISKPDLEKFIFERIETTVHGAYLDYRNIRSFLNWCIENSYLERNLIAKVKFPIISEKENLYITPDQFKKIVESETNNLLKDIYIFAYHTGARLGEILHCRLSWINLDERIVRIKNDSNFTTKSKKERIIPINDSTFNVVVRNIPKIKSIYQDEYLFRKNTVKVNESYVSHSFKEVVRELFGEDTSFHFHNLRGSFGSELIRKNISAYTVMTLMGHSSISVTEKNYLSIKVEELKKAVNLLGE